MNAAVQEVAKAASVEDELGLDFFEPADEAVEAIVSRAAKYGYWLSEHTTFTSVACDCTCDDSAAPLNLWKG